MFEAHVLYLLRKYLGEYVEGLSAEALRISVWKGNVILKDLKLRAEALNALNLPVIVKAGFVGTITLKVPWKSLGKEPVIVLFDRVFLLANPAPDGQALKEEDREKLFQSKLRDIQETETVTLEAARRSKAGTTPGGSSWLASLISTIIGNLKVTISNVHIRYEDNISNPGHPFCTGFTLSRLAAFTMDDQGNETFDTSGALDKLRKSVQLQRLALYHDSDSKPWTLDKRWEDLTPNEWTEIFQEGIHEDSSLGFSVWSADRKYLVSPISGVLKYHRLGKQERHDPEIPFEKASLVLSDVSLTVSESQYHDSIKLLETFSRHKTRIEVSHLRPLVSVSENRRAWWRYAMLAGLQQKKLCYWFSWDRIRHLCHLRRRYVHLYVASLQQNSDGDISEIRQIERNLDSKVIVLWRLLAHAKLESVKSKEASQQRVAAKKSWWPFVWSTTGDAPAVSNPTNSESDNPSESQFDEEEKLTKDEWKAINEMLSYQPDEDGTFLSGKELQNMIHYLVDISVAKAAARIVNINGIEVICGRFEQLQVSSKLYSKSVHCDVSLKFCGLSSPEGSLAESVISERKTNALEATFIHAPIGEDVDWRLAATIAPCHVTVLMDSYERFLDFMKRSNAVSPTVTMETATVLQMQIEKVTRKAQEQFQMVLEEESRFALYIDLDAPKIRIPIRASGHTSKDCQFLLDFGHFTLHTREVSRDEERQILYSRFLISGRDMAAFFRDNVDEEREYLTPKFDIQSSSLFSCWEDGDKFYSLLDRCGMSVVVDQIKVPHPSHPATRIAIQVPNLGLHFSAERYCRILYLVEILCGGKRSNEQNFDGCQQPGHKLWHPVDLTADARILVWKGLGNSLAKWQSCHIVLSGLYLYVMESEASNSYRRCSSMSGKQVLDVPPTSVGGSAYAIAVSYRGIDIQKALESSTTVTIEFNSYEEKSIWIKELVQATYRASAPPAMDILVDSTNTLPESSGPQIGNFGSANLVINGSLVETKLSIYGKLGRKWASNKESSILELVASGGKVNLVQSGSGLTMKMKLHALKIKDELQSRLSTSPQYLACSVLNDKFKVVGTSEVDPAVDELQTFLEEDDCFNDALSDFVSTPDHYSQSHECTYNPFSTENAENILIRDKDVSVTDKGQLKLKVGEMFYEAHDSSISDFVAVTFVTRNPDSPLYDGIDTQMSIGMSSLEFFCNRPSLVALIEFGLDLSLVNSGSNMKDNLGVLPTDSKANDKEESGPALIKGLLGYGKDRVVFNLRMDVDSVHVFLNKEDGSQLAVFVQESFFLDLKVHPSSIAIEGTLGNMRLCDMSLGPDSRWGWLCDIRNQGIESLIKFRFQSYSVDDDDYQGYAYSLTGHLSAVRIVFLYRFVQEITSYFMELASPHTEEVIKFVDKIGGFEWLIQKCEMDGATAVKLDLSLDTPIIIIPKSSTSGDYMQLDLGQLQVKNSLSWHGSKEDDPSAVHLDTLHADIHGFNMSIGLNGVLGKPMIRDGKGIHIEVRRTLRDVFRKVPTLAFKFKIGFLHIVMSDKEYDVIINCILMNLSERPNLPPSFRDNSNGTKDSMRMLADKVTLNGQMLLSRTIMIMAVEVHYALLELCNGPDDESHLAQIALEDLWVSYRTTSFFEVDLYVTITKLSVFDLRPDTKDEMRLMLGSYTDSCKPESNRPSVSTTMVSSFFDSSFNKVENSNDMDFSNLTMFIMDWRWRSSFQSLVIRIQQPRILVVLDFLLSVAEFFVRSLGSITGRGETLNPKNDPLTNSDDIVLSESSYFQKDDIVQLSPKRQLIVDGWGVDEFIYDGCGHILSLKEEVDVKGQLYTGNVIIVGRGKKLLFRNVKIENGALLRKCTYLNCGSSYSVSPDDGVEIMYFESSANGSDYQGSVECQESKEEPKVSEKDAHPSPNQPYSFTFEAQVVSPEFTFYDTSRLLCDDSVNFEKLLRAKVDMSFIRYASKDNDTWTRSLVKDLTVEAGSGLVILEPVDISAGYTFVKEKTNISLVSTDLCINISLSVASLLLKLQNQAFSTLQFGNVNPLTSCTNFKRIWVSPKGSLPGYNLTFWRPQAPSNYAILGDCVTSRPLPPSSVVVAVSNIYGRVRKPLGFKLLGFVSFYEEPEENVQRNNDCSIWIPIPPPGYSAVGCVAHLGDEPPQNHVVYCLRSDLATSASFSHCMFYIPPNSRVSRGFSIWRVDNAVGSFYAQCSVDYPPKQDIFDLHQVLLQRPDCYLSTNCLTLGTPVANKQKGQEGENNNSGSSGWDILRSFSRTSACYLSTPHFERIWWDKGFDQRRPISIWRPIIRPGFAILGDCITEGLEPPALGLIFKCDDPTFSVKPVQFTKVAHVAGKSNNQAFFWYPIAPPGYAAIGCVVTKTDEVPDKNFICCPRIDLVSQTNVSNEPISRSSISKGSNCWSIWKIENQACTFLARSDFIRPSSRLAYSLTNYAKPKVPDNITAEMKLTSLSLRVLNSIFGTVTPLFDATVMNINLATHGRLEAMTAVLICSIAASTFNRQLESWEPLIEPFDGILRIETYDTSKHPPQKIGKRVSFAATTPVNLNASAAHLDALAETIASWDRQNDFQKNCEEDGYNLGRSTELTSALDDEDIQKVTIENKIGCDVYLRKVDLENSQLLESDRQVSLLIPPPQFSDKLNAVRRPSETRFYAVIKISGSKGLPIVDDGNSQECFCALRLLINSKASDQYKLFPQSARTRCVRPSMTKVNDLVKGDAEWNEVFIFEVPEKGYANLEVEITNLGSKAGKGEVIGAVSIPINVGDSSLKRASSLKVLQQASDGQQMKYSLRRKMQGQIIDSGGKDCGILLISTSCLKRSAEINNKQLNMDSSPDRDVGFWIGLRPEGPWESISAVLPLSVVPKTLDRNPIAFEIVIKNGKKHVILRSLALVINDTDIKLEVSLCPAAVLYSQASIGTSSSSYVTEEVFENQRYQPISGWGNKSSGANDPEQWSFRDFSFSSKEFFEPALPDGWKWSSAWKIEKSPFVDNEGWAYGTDFQGLKWPPSSSRLSSKSASDFVRRRRWIRTRQQFPQKVVEDTKKFLAAIDPGSSTYLPCACMIKDSEVCLQVRPYIEKCEERYTWGQLGTFGSGKEQSYNQNPSASRQNSLKHLDISLQNTILRLDQLEKKDVLLYCNPRSNNKQHFWLCVGTDCSVLQTELNTPVYDWRISLNSTLRLENRLPCEAEYAAWEKTSEGNLVERQHGIVPSGGSAALYTFDVRKPVYLTMSIQGGWVLEKDAILILDLVGLEHATSFWIVQQQTSRRLQVSVEHDMGGTDGAPKVVRFFVPYWIQNDSLIPLSYRIVEMAVDSQDSDSLLISRAVKSAKLAVKHSSKSFVRRNSSMKRNLQLLEFIEDISAKCVMLSPQDYINRNVISQFQPRGNNFISSRVGISASVYHSENYAPGISLLELENKERVDFNAYTYDGSYYKLSAQLKMTSDRTKVVSIIPQTLFINRTGQSICLSHFHYETEEWIHPTDGPKLFKWQSGAKNELLKLCLSGYKWSTPFSIETNGVIWACMHHQQKNDQMFVKIQVKGSTKSSRYEVIFCLASLTSPYRIENRSLFLTVRVRQVDSTNDSWQSLLPNSAAPFFWQDLGRQRLLEMLVDGADPCISAKYNIDEVIDHHPMLVSNGPSKALRISVHKEGKTLVSRISDWMPENETQEYLHQNVPLSILQASEVQSQQSSETDSEFHVNIELSDLGLSIVDHMPEEILYLSVQNLLLSYSSGLGSGISRFKMRMQEIQVDNQLPFSPMPVLFRAQRSGDQKDFIFKFSMTMQADNSVDYCVYPYIGLQVLDNSVFLVNIHEPIIWRLHEMFQQIKLDKVLTSSNTAVSVDSTIRIGILNISEIRFKVSMAMSPAQRPRGVLGFWSSLMTALGNTEHMPVYFAHRFREDVCMSQSALMSIALSNIKKDLLSRPLQLLSGVDILGNASSALSNMSKGVAALSMDKKFIQGRQKQDSKGVEDFSDVIREGGGALAKGFFRGFTGILTKPLEGAKSSGVEGFVSGVGKGLIGVAAQPVSGVLDLLSKTTEGANAVRMKISSAITSEEQLLRKRLPRVIGGDNLLRPYDDYRAQGQAILQLAESGTFFGQVDLFRVRGKFAFSDAYEDHFLLPKGKIIIVTHRRVLLLQQPTHIIAQRKFNPARDPCSVLWDVLWGDLTSMELAQAKKEHQSSPPSRLLLYLQMKLECRESVHVIKCTRGSQQAFDIYSSIQQALDTYGPKASKDLQKRKVPMPYSPSAAVFFPEVVSKEAFGNQGSITMDTMFGTQ